MDRISFSKLEPLLEKPTCHTDESIFPGNSDCYYGSVGTSVMKLCSFVTLLSGLACICVAVVAFVFVHLLIAELQGTECDCRMRLIKVGE